MERVRVFQTDSDPLDVEVFRVLNVDEHPELREIVLAGELNRLDDGEPLGLPFVYHDPGAMQFALVIPPGARARELSERARLLDSLMNEHEEEVPDYVRHFAIVYGHQELAAYVDDDSERMEVDVAELEPVDSAPVVASYYPRLAGLLPPAGFRSRSSTELAPLIDDDELWLFASVAEDEHEAFGESTSDLLVQLKTVDQLPICVLALTDRAAGAARRAYLSPTPAADGRILELLRRDFRANIVVRDGHGRVLRSFRLEAPRAANANMILGRTDRAPTAPQARWQDAIATCRAVPPSLDDVDHPFALREEAETADVALRRLTELEAWSTPARTERALLVVSVPRTVFELSRRQIVADALRFGLAMSDSLVLQAVRFGFSSNAESLVATLEDRFRQTLSAASEHGLDEDQIQANFEALEVLSGLHGTSTGPNFSYTMEHSG